MMGIETCPGFPFGAPNGIFWVEQQPGTPCKWEYQDSLYWVTLNHLGIVTQLYITAVPGILQRELFAGVEPPCSSDFTNLLVACLITHGCKNGTGYVHWPGP